MVRRQHSGRIPWRLACALFATLASGETNIVSTNSRTGVAYDGIIQLQDSSMPVQNITTLVPLTGEAMRKSPSGELFYTSDSNYNVIAAADIAYVSCDASAYKGNVRADNVLQNVLNSGRAAAAILYSTESNYCNYSSDDATTRGGAIYSTTDMAAAKALRDTLTAQPAGTKFFARVTLSEPTDNGSAGVQGLGGGAGGLPNPLGPSPSTAVAMIILYSITGLITGLFLIIVVTGAVRAHRHPDRYGPRDVMGRPRQSRARGLGMAILDTIPIVKFGEREPAKPADVELGSTAEASVDAGTAARATDAEAAGRDGVAPVEQSEEPGRGSVGSEQRGGDDMESGIAPAAAVVAGTQATSSSSSSPDEGLGCSICTDDFEKGQDIRVLPCNHKFHPECVDPWLLNVSGTCPLCRVDLRPTSSHSQSHSHSQSSNGSLPNTNTTPATNLALTPEAARRHSTLRNILSFRSRPNASADERISALRQLREQRRNTSREGVGGGAEDGERDRRRNRMSMRLSGVFGGARRRSLEAGEAGAAGAASAASREAVASSNSTSNPNANAGSPAQSGTETR